jgi:hypothetical protein
MKWHAIIHKSFFALAPHEFSRAMNAYDEYCILCCNFWRATQSVVCCWTCVQVVVLLFGCHITLGMPSLVSRSQVNGPMGTNVAM